MSYGLSRRRGSSLHWSVLLWEHCFTWDKESDSSEFGCEMFFLSSCVCTFDRQLVALFGDAVGPLKGLSRKKWFPRGGHYSFYPSLDSVPTLSLLPGPPKHQQAPTTTTAATPCSCPLFSPQPGCCVSPQTVSQNGSSFPQQAGKPGISSQRQEK